MSNERIEAQRRYVAFAVNNLAREKGDSVTMEDIRATVADAVKSHGAHCMAADGVLYFTQEQRKDGTARLITKPIPEDGECGVLARADLETLIQRATQSWPGAVQH